MKQSLRIFFTLKHSSTQALKHSSTQAMRRSLRLCLPILFFTLNVGAQITAPECPMDDLEYFHLNNPSGLSSGDDCITFNYSVSQTGCDDYRDYAPVDLTRVPIKKIRLIFHVFQKDDGTRNFQNTPADLALLNSVTPELNSMFAGVSPLSHPTPSCPPEVILDSRIRFEHEDTYFYTDSDAWCAAHHKNENPHGCDLFDTYVSGNTSLTTMQKENAVHIFVLGCRRNQFGTGPEVFDLGGFASGIPSNDEKFIVVKGWYNIAIETSEPWQMTHDITSNFAHEFGHSFGLPHTFNNDNCCDTHPGAEGTTNNFMDNAYGRAISECQMARMHYFLEGKSSNDIHKAVMTDYCTEDTGHEVIIPNGVTEIWDVDRKFNSDIRVETGGQLIIKCVVGMPTNGEIYVERGARLFINGGTITHNKTRWWGCTSGKWGGIRVAGNTTVEQTPGMRDETYTLDPSGPGFVIVKDGTLEFAINAISTQSKGILWPDSENYWGGFIYAENSFFYNNNRSVEFMKYDHTSYSGFKNCEFFNLDGTANYGVTDWATHGLTFEECHFKDLNKIGIQTYDAGISVVSCVFDDLDKGIETYSTYPLATNLEIGNSNPLSGNIFNNNHVGVHSTASINLFVRNNTFNEYSLFGVAVNGNSQYKILNNTFKTKKHPSVVAIGLVQTGTKFNEIRCNSHETNYWSIDFRGNNSNTHFYDQNFNGIYDVRLENYYSSPGSLPTNIGSSVDARYNYFTVVSGNLQHINTVGSTTPFRYWHPQASSGSTLIPKCSINNPSGCIYPNDFITSTGFGGNSDCDPSGGGGGPKNGEDYDLYNDCFTLQCLNELDDLINSIDPENLPDDELSVYEGMLTQRNRIFWTLINEFIAEKDFQAAEDLLVIENTEIANMNLFGLKMLQKDYSAAETVLENLNQSGEDNSFRDVQYINLKLYNSDTDYEITDSEVDILQSISLSDGHGSGYARGLLALTQGITYYPELPELQEGLEVPEQIGSKHELNTEELRIYPNPATDLINIEIRSLLFEKCTFTIYNALGAQVSHMETIKDSNFILSTKSFGKGMFFGVLRNNGNDIGLTKFIVQ